MSLVAKGCLVLWCSLFKFQAKELAQGSNVALPQIHPSPSGVGRLGNQEAQQQATD